MSKKKHNKRAPQATRQMVRLSQCMIVKNEEKNIKQALSWAKDITFEQIVVDTGSTDRTVEIAESMGAKVFHFEWINDFSAAKNYAIEQAKGDWIAFLDADEYFSPQDTKKLMPFLNHIMSDRQLRDKWLVIQCPLANVDDSGKVFSTNTQERIFRNIPTLRYEGKIHEKLNVHVDNTVHGDDITIIHTGYSATSFDGTNKIDRNIQMLEAELKDNPDNASNKGYLAEALMLKSRLEGNIAVNSEKIDALFYEVINEDKDVLPLVRKNAYLKMLQTYIGVPERLEECEKLCVGALNVFPDDLDFEYFYSVVLCNKAKYTEALRILEKSEAKLSGGNVIDSQIISSNPELLYRQKALVIEHLKSEATSSEPSQDETDGHLFDLLHSGDEALNFICEQINMDSTDSCIVVAESLKELYENIADCIKNNDIKEKHRGSEAALNAALASEKLREVCAAGEIEKAAALTSYELLPLHLFLTTELNFWFSIYPDIAKMRNHRDMIIENISEFRSVHKQMLEEEYSYDVSIMVLCYNKVYLTKIAFESLLKYTNFEKYNVEIILVNNGSDDNGETSDFLESINDPRVRTVNLKHPLGYNGYALGPLGAGGRYFVEFHTDVIATENWLDNLMKCITSDPQIGAVAAVSNKSSNYQEILTEYPDPAQDDTEMQKFAREFNHSDPTKWEERSRVVPTSGLIIPTMLYQKLLRDPWFYNGQFSDDDLSAFLRRGGFKQIVTKDTFLHHFGSQTSGFNQDYNNSLKQSRDRFFMKWETDAWYNVIKNDEIVIYINTLEIKDSESLLFIDPLFGTTSQFICNEFRKRGKKLGETVAIVSDVLFTADSQHFYDNVITGSVKDSLLQIKSKFDHIVFHPDISDYIDEGFPEMLKALHSKCKPNAKIIFSLRNPAYYKLLYDVVNGNVSIKPYDSQNGIRFIDPLYIFNTAVKQGFICKVTNVKEPSGSEHTELLRLVQNLAKDDKVRDEMNSVSRVFELGLK